MSGAAGAETRLVLESADAARTRRIGALIAAVLAPSDVLLLSGGLGAGKTTLTKGLVGALGGDERAVRSPTFTLMVTYETSPPVAHVDCWRLEQLAEVLDLGLSEVLDDGGIAVIEWGEAAAPLLGAGALRVHLSAPGELAGERRRIVVSDEGASPRIAALGEAAAAAGLVAADGPA